MIRAIALAESAGVAGEVPVGAVIVAQNWHLNQCTLYVTLEPCPMCAGAIVQARVSLLVYGADDPKTGAIRTAANIPDSACSYHRLSVLGGILESACRQQLQAWFTQRRHSSRRRNQR